MSKWDLLAKRARPITSKGICSKEGAFIASFVNFLMFLTIF